MNVNIDIDIDDAIDAWVKEQKERSWNSNASIVVDIERLITKILSAVNNYEDSAQVMLDIIEDADFDLRGAMDARAEMLAQRAQDEKDMPGGFNE
jgi:hypothetical protein